MSAKSGRGHVRASILEGDESLEKLTKPYGCKACVECRSVRASDCRADSLQETNDDMLTC